VEELKDFPAGAPVRPGRDLSYSHEEGTSAHQLEDTIPPISNSSGHRRSWKFSRRSPLRKNQEKVGRVFKVLIDKKEAGRYLGRTEFDSVEVDNEVIIHSDERLPIGEFVRSASQRRMIMTLKARCV
jgi:ribosomal protein S12 methylthiotransferase